MTEQQIICATQQWLTSFVIAYNICPFAQREHQRNSIRYSVSDTTSTEEALQGLITECQHLDHHPDTSTTLLILPVGLTDFDDYLDLLALAEQLLVEQGYEGIYQLASFHPDYRFADSETEDPADYTNRSPYPMLHIIRESSLEQALASYPDPENIPERNIILTRKLGMEKLQNLLSACFQTP